MKSLTLFSAFILTVALANAQSIDLDANNDCIVWQVTGKASYTLPSESKPVNIVDGMTLPPEATLQIGPRSSVSLVQNDQMYSIDKKGKVTLRTVLSGPASSQSKGMRDFAKMMSSAKGYVGEGTKSSSDTSKAKGWGDKDKIHLIFPSGSKVPKKSFSFSWTPVEAAGTYTLRVQKDKSGQPLLEAVTKSAMFNVDLSQLALNTGTNYLISVSANNNAIKSNEATFSVFDPQEEQTALAGLFSEKEYQKSSPSQKSMMEAATLETYGLLTLAMEKYQKAIASDARNPLLKDMYAAFLQRHDLGFVR